MSRCIPDVAAEYVAAMKDVRDLSEDKHDLCSPIVCFNEKVITLHADGRAP